MRCAENQFYCNTVKGMRSSLIFSIPIFEIPAFPHKQNDNLDISFNTTSCPPNTIIKNGLRYVSLGQLKLKMIDTLLAVKI